MRFAIGEKINMTQIFNDEGIVCPVTALKVKPVTITNLLTKEKNGYSAVQVGYGQKKLKNVSKAQHFNGNAFSDRKEFRMSEDASDMKVGEEINPISFLNEGDIIKISSISKGKGFQGVVKRHGFHGAPRTHGTHKGERRGGSIGGGPLTRVIKGKKMPGRMGTDRVTIKNVKIMKILPNEQMILVKGSIPGSRGSVVEIREN